MRLLLRVAVVLLLAAGSLWFLAVDARPLVDRDTAVSSAALAEARRLLASNDPRRLRAGEQRQAVLPLALADQAFNHLASRYLNGRGALAASGDSVQLRLTLPAPWPASRYLNLRATLTDADGRPHLAAVRLGSLPIPVSLAEYAVASTLRAQGIERRWQLARHAVRRLVFDPARQNIVLDYVWEPAVLEHMRVLAFAAGDVARLRAAQTVLTATLAPEKTGSRIALTSALKPLLAADADCDYRRAALLVLAAYLAERNLAAAVPDAAAWPRPRRVKLTLRNRYDSAQHFAVSAALAAWADEPIADAVGRQKEFDDARRGSGFSFADLAADRAGTRFGRLVAEGSDRLHALLQTDIADADLLPPLFIAWDSMRRVRPWG
jgi:hypothetical protein